MDEIFKHHKPTHTSSIVITPPPTHTGHTGLVVSVVFLLMSPSHPAVGMSDSVPATV